MNPENLREPWKKGESGNPAGRPKGSRSLSTILQEMLDEEITVNEGGEQKKKVLADVIIRKLIRKAHDGDIKAIREIFDRIEGRPLQKIDQTNTEKPKFVITVKRTENGIEREKTFTATE